MLRVVHVVLVAPDALEQPLARQHAAGALDHVAEQLELLVREPDLLAPVAHDVGVELDLPVLVAVALRRLAARRVATQRDLGSARPAPSG